MVICTFLYGEHMVRTHVFITFSNTVTHVFLHFLHHFVSKMMVNIRVNRVNELFNHCENYSILCKLLLKISCNIIKKNVTSASFPIPF